MDVAEDGTIELEQDKLDMIESLYAQLSDAKAQLQGQHYSRMLVYSDLPTQSDESYALISQIHGVADSYYGDDVYVTGNATAARDLKDSFSTDNILVSVLSAVFVVLVIMFVFRSAGLSVLLIAVIQGSIWLNFSISYFTQNSIFFVGYLIVSAIQMGANIDYAIVVSNRYLELRQRNVSRPQVDTPCAQRCSAHARHKRQHTRHRRTSHRLYKHREHNFRHRTCARPRNDNISAAGAVRSAADARLGRQIYLAHDRQGQKASPASAF